MSVALASLTPWLRPRAPGHAPPTCARSAAGRAPSGSASAASAGPGARSRSSSGLPGPMPRSRAESPRSALWSCPPPSRPVPSARSAPRRPAPVPRASASSTGFWAVGSSPVPSCCWRASLGWASPPCFSTSPPRPRRRPVGGARDPSSTSPARSPRARSACGRSASVASTRRSCSRRRPSWGRCSARWRRPAPRSSWSIRCRLSPRRRSKARRAVSPRCERSPGP